MACRGCNVRAAIKPEMPLPTMATRLRLPIASLLSMSRREFA